MNMAIGPLTVSLVQVFLLMVGLGAALGTFQLVSNGSAGNKTAGLIVAIPVLLVFVIIAFFKISEMGLLEFVTKMVRNYFFDSNQKFQTQYTRITDPQSVLLERVRTSEKTEKIETKKLLMDEQELENIRKGGLL